MSGLRTLAFGDGSLWGAAWVADPAGTAVGALGAGPEAIVLPALKLSGAGAGDEWRLEGEGIALVASAAGELVDVRAGRGGIEGWNQFCRVTGRLERDGARHEVDCLGLRSGWPDGVEVGHFESIRAVSVWFEPDEALSIMAFRPRKAKAHDGDALAGAVILADGSPTVEHPRLSTTYVEDGWPARAGIELWLEGAEPEQQYPRRASGEATGARAHAVIEGLEVRAEPFRWHSRGREGAGIYLLARPR